MIEKNFVHSIVEIPSLRDIQKCLGLCLEFALYSAGKNFQELVCNESTLLMS